MKKFVSLNHRSMQLELTVFVNLFFIALLCFFGFRKGNPETQAFAITFLLVVAIFTDFSLFRISKSGLYIDGKNFYKQGYFIRTEIDLEKVKIIKKIETAIPPTKYQRAKLLKDNHGNQLYSTVFLNGEIPHIDSYPHDYALVGGWNNDRVMFKTIYDKDAIDYILTLNPNIKIL